MEMLHTAVRLINLPRDGGLMPLCTSKGTPPGVPSFSSCLCITSFQLCETCPSYSTLGMSKYRAISATFSVFDPLLLGRNVGGRVVLLQPTTAGNPATRRREMSTGSTTLTRASAEWFRRPPDVRYLSLTDLHAATLERSRRSRSDVIANEPHCRRREPSFRPPLPQPS